MFLSFLAQACLHGLAVKGMARSVYQGTDLRKPYCIHVLRILFRLAAAALLSWHAGTAGAATADTVPVAREIRLQLDNGEYLVPAVLSLPADDRAAAVPAVLMLHGTASHKDEVGQLYRRLAQALAARGVASIRIDFAGNGDSPVDGLHYSLASACRDAELALSTLGARDDVDAGRLGILGFSQGGLIAQLVVARDPRLKAMATWSSVAMDGIGTFQPLFDQYYGQARQQGYATLEFAWRPPLKLSRAWFEQVREATALRDMGHYQGALLAIAGTADELVPWRSSLDLIQATGSTDASLVLIKGGNHIYNVLDEDQGRAEELLAITALWFARHL